MRSLTLFAFACLALSAVSAEYKMVCYLGTWAIYRNGNGAFAPENIDANLCTHAIYSFVGLDERTLKLKILDENFDLPENKDGLARFNNLRKKNPNLKTLIAVGGWNEGLTDKYSRMAASPSSRSAFVKSAVEFVAKYKFDGFDVDWEYPNKEGGARADVDNFTKLLRELREALPKGSLLTAAVGPAISRVEQSYNMLDISKELDFINLMTYDLHGKWDSTTGMHSALHKVNGDPLNDDTIVQYWLAAGVPKEKLILGVPTYGRAFKLTNPSNTAVGAPAGGQPQAGTYTKEAGFLAYYEICEKTESGEFTKVFDEARGVPYAYGDDQWISYDDPASVEMKAKYVKENGLGGAMIWSLETDDFKGLCGTGPFPLLTTLNHVLRNGKPITVTKSNIPKKLPGQSRPVVPKVDLNSRFGGDEPSDVPEATGKCTGPKNIPDPQDKTRYIACPEYGPGYSMPCPQGLEFNAQIQVCDWPKH